LIRLRSGRATARAMTKSFPARPGRPPQFTHRWPRPCVAGPGQSANFPASSSSTLGSARSAPSGALHGAVSFRGGGCRTEPPRFRRPRSDPCDDRN